MIPSPSDAAWDDVRSALDAQGYAGQPLDAQGLILIEVIDVATAALQTHYAAGTLDEVPLLKVQVIKNARGGSCIALYVRDEFERCLEPRWTT